MNPNFKYHSNILLLLFCTFMCTFGMKLNGQVLINGANVHSLNNSLIYIQTDSLILQNNAYFNQEGYLLVDRDVVVNGGKLDIDGTIDIENDLINNDSIVGLSAASLFLLNGNWINNSFFIPGQNTTVLDGATQNITGTTNTTFFNLRALGGLTDIKELIGVNASVLNVLDLGDVELATNIQNLSVYNPALNAIVRNDGFVSSLDTGKLERVTNTTASYLFPTGSSLGVLRYRPLEIVPRTATVDTFGARLANLNATAEGFDVLNLGDSLCAINPNFYHRIYGNSNADITMFYLPQEDGEWDAMGQWSLGNQWEKLPDEFQGTSGQFTTMTVPNWASYSPEAFALGIQNPFLLLEDTIEINQGEVASINPIYQGVFPEEYLWLPSDEVDCPNCLDTEVSPTITSQYNLEITVTQNCIIRDSVIILVIPGGLYLPTAFSPNNDGVNDLFRPLNNNLDSYEISIYNRWGELVYQSSDFTKGWDGIYKGQNAGLGVYTYKAFYKLNNQTEEYSLSGNVTLIR